MADAPAGTIRPDENGPAHSEYDATSEAAVAGYGKVDSGKVGPTLTGGDDWTGYDSESPYKQV